MGEKTVTELTTQPASREGWTVTEGCATMRTGGSDEGKAPAAAGNGQGRSESRQQFQPCGYTETRGLYAPLTCGREKGHTGTHIDFRPNASIGFGPRRPSERTP